MNSQPTASDALAQVRRLLNSALSSAQQVAHMSVADLDLTLRISRRVRLLGLLAHRMRESGLLESLPEPAIEQLNSASATADARARLARWELDRVAWALGDDDSLHVLTLKGATYLLLDLPNATGRYFADVDLLVAERDLDAVETGLKKRKWRSKGMTDYDERYYREWAHEIPPMVHAEREVEVDVHHNILPRTARLKPSAACLLGRAWPLPGSWYHVLCNADIVVHAMTHLMYASDMADRLRDLVDIDLMLRHFAEHDAGFWDDLIQRAEQLDLDRPAYYALRYSAELLGTPVPAAAMERMAGRGPPAFVVRVMDWLVPRALYPQHPDFPSRMTKFARLLLYIRLHWISMPPVMLIRHLTYKFFVGRSWRPAWFKTASA